MLNLFFIMLLFMSPAYADDSANPENSIEIEEPHIPDPDLCVGCSEEEEKTEEPQLTIEIRIDPLTGNIRYVVRGLVLE
jgi:hypothetical protein